MSKVRLHPPLISVLINSCERRKARVYLLAGNMFEAGEVVLGSEQVGDFLPPAFGHRFEGSDAVED